MTILLDGRPIARLMAERLAAQCRALTPPPQLLIVQVGERPESTLYIERKQKFGESIGAMVTVRRYLRLVTANILLADLAQFNADPNVHGIIIQLPLPDHLDPASLLNAVAPTKDVDGLSASSLQAAWHNRAGFRPATARGVLTLLEHYHIALAGKRVTVVGRSALVGKPIALACLNAGATVTVAHRGTADLAAATRVADILIVAAGAPGLITPVYVAPPQVVIDVGINVVDGQKLLEEISLPTKRRVVGDVDFSTVSKIVAAISPVPGGVGPLTIACLFENLMTAYQTQIK